LPIVETGWTPQTVWRWQKQETSYNKVLSHNYLFAVTGSLIWHNEENHVPNVDLKPPLFSLYEIGVNLTGSTVTLLPEHPVAGFEAEGIF
jgi:hypothetical protein